MYYRTESPDHGFKFDPFKALLVPRPIGWVTTQDKNGVLNLAPYSFFNGVADKPPMVMYSVAGQKDSLVNIEQTGECTFSIVTRELAEKMNVSSAPFASEVNEINASGLTMAPSKEVTPPRIAESPAALEGKLWKTVELPTPASGEPYTVVFVQIVGVYIDDSFINDGQVDSAKMQPVSRLGYMDYGVLTPDRVFTLNRPLVNEAGLELVETEGEWDGVYR